MIQLNLLPDVKQEYIKAERTRRLVLSVCIIVALASIAILILLFSVDRLQRKHIGDLTDDIKTKTSELQKKPQITKILTVQNQLNSLTALHDGKPAASRLAKYLNQITPTQVDISSITIDFNTQTITLSGSADSLSSVNKYVDTLKYTKYSTEETKDITKAFSGVVLSNFGISSSVNTGAKPASYSITFTYDKNIFDSKQKITLLVPSQVTTRASVDQPSDLFNAAPGTSTKAGGR